MNNIKPFRFWCQKVLPLVYEDALSYYELLCKVVAKLNEVIDQSNELSEAFQQLKEYVDNYFTNLNVQEEINNKLDEMAADGTLADLISAYIKDNMSMYYNVWLDGIHGNPASAPTAVSQSALITVAIQHAIAAGKAGLYFPNYISNDNSDTAYYYLDATINIPSNFAIVSNGAYFYHTSESGSNCALLTEGDGTKGGYGGTHDVLIQGVHFYVPSTSIQITSFAAGHGQRIRIRDCVFEGNPGWHMIELNASADCVIEGCSFINYGLTLGGYATESIQIDSAESDAYFPWYGPWDKTACTRIKILKCYAYRNSTLMTTNTCRFPAFVGNHTSENNNSCSCLEIAECYTENYGSLCWFSGVTRLNVHNNTTISCANGVIVQSNTLNNSRIIVHDNVFQGNTDLKDKGWGVRFNSDVNLFSRIYNNDISYCNYGILLERTRYIIVQNNEIQNCGLYGIEVTGNNIYADLFGNVCYSNGTSDIHCTVNGDSDISFRDNKCSDLGCFVVDGSKLTAANVIGFYFNAIKYNVHVAEQEFIKMAYNLRQGVPYPA